MVVNLQAMNELFVVGDFGQTACYAGYILFEEAKGAPTGLWSDHNTTTQRPLLFSSSEWIL